MYKLTIEFKTLKELKEYIDLASKLEDIRIEEIVEKDRKNHGLDYDKGEE